MEKYFDGERIYTKTVFIENIVRDMDRLYIKWMSEHPNALEAFVLGPNELLSFRHQEYQKFPIGRRMLKFRGLPVYLKRAAGIDVILKDTYASTFAIGDTQVEELSLEEKVQ
jgi:hypothetical protein